MKKLIYVFFAMIVLTFTVGTVSIAKEPIKKGRTTKRDSSSYITIPIDTSASATADADTSTV